MWKNIKTYIISIAIALAVGGLAAFLTRNSMDIYSEIILPPLAPSSILFPIVWTVLYVFMGIGSARVYQLRRSAPRATEKALTYYAMNLIANFTWSIIFFNFRAYLAAFFWLLLLLYIIIKMIISFEKVSPFAAYLQIPYALWVTFAGYLNFSIWYLNK